MSTAASAGTDTAATQPLSIGEIAQRILLIRSQRVLLDSDLAGFYGESTKRLNQQVNRNRRRFPEDFMFQLSDEEFANLRLQIATSSGTASGGKASGHGGRRFAPLVFTEHGAIMASKVHSMERKVSVHERNIAELADSMAQLLNAPPAPPKRPIGFVLPEDKGAGSKSKTALATARTKSKR